MIQLVITCFQETLLFQKFQSLHKLQVEPESRLWNLVSLTPKLADSNFIQLLKTSAQELLTLKSTRITTLKFSWKICPIILLFTFHLQELRYQTVASFSTLLHWISQVRAVLSWVIISRPMLLNAIATMQLSLSQVSQIFKMLLITIKTQTVLISLVKLLYSLLL